LRFDVTNNETLYERYLQKYDEVTSNAELSDAKFANVRLIEPASPNPVPAFPHRLLNAMLAVILGGLGGIGVALAMNYFSNKLNTVEDVEAAGVLALGSVPKLLLRSKRKRVGDIDRDCEAFSLIAEQLLGRGSTGFVLSGTSLRVGCSTVSAGLVAALAKHVGRRLLIVQTDGRPVQQRNSSRVIDPAIGARAADDERGIAEIIQRTSYSNVDVLAVSAEAARDLDAAALRALLGSSLSTYDLILVDAPPIFAAPTAFALAKGMTGWGIVLVIEAGRTSAQILHRVAELVERQGITLAGAILNKREDSLPAFLYHRL
jgi:Mrp family chromosome partitioning ATPase